MSRLPTPTAAEPAPARRPARRRRARALPVVVAFCTLLVACGSDTTSSPAATAPPAATGGGGAGSERNPGDYAEYGVYERVNFPRGSTGTTVSGGVVRGTVNGYLFGASAGQRMTVEIIPGERDNAVFDLYDPSDKLLTGGRYALVDPLPANGDYLVVVQSEAGNASFDMKVEITTPDPADAGAAAEASSCPAGYTEFDGQYPLRICHKGETVKTLQALLVDLGYKIDVDGFFGPATQAALVEEFGEGNGEITAPSDMEALWDCDADC